MKVLSQKQSVVSVLLDRKTRQIYTSSQYLSQDI